MSRKTVVESGLFLREFAPRLLLGAILSLTLASALLARDARDQAAPIIANDHYKLVALDTIQVQVFEWRPAKDELFAWTAINREYKIGPSGSLTLPLVGEIVAAGLTTQELAIAIARRLRARLNLSILPDATVQIVAYRPVYVTGDVERVGEVAFTPGMTALQAFSLGGGLRRTAEQEVSRAAREIISTSGDLEVLLRERAMLVARAARLEAELADKDEVATPADAMGLELGAKPGHLAEYLQQERQVFEGRRQSHRAQVKALLELKHHLEQEVTSLSRQLQTHDKQIQLMQSELEGISNLASQRLATQPRLLGLQRTIAQLEGERLRIQGALARAQQEAKRAGISVIEFENKSKGEIINELQTTAFRLDVVNQRAATARRLLVEAAASDIALGSTSPTIGPTYTIVRQVDGNVVTMKATEETRLEAGDILKVKRSLHDDAQVSRHLSRERQREGSPALAFTRPRRSSIELDKR